MSLIRHSLDWIQLKKDQKLYIDKYNRSIVKNKKKTLYKKILELEILLDNMEKHQK